MKNQHTSRRHFAALIALCLIFGFWGAPAGAAAASKELEIYFIDVEGGQSTLLVTPEHHSFLIDTGWAGQGTGYQPGDPSKARDANRIAAAAHDAGIRQIDYLLITHFHPDHVGGVSELSKLLPIHTFIDHATVDPDAARSGADIQNGYDAYLKVRGHSPHVEPQPGDRLPIDDLNVLVVSSAKKLLSAPLPSAGAKNAACAPEAPPPSDPYENPRSTGVLVTFGTFRFLDVGDLSGQPLFDLACPASRIGPVDVYLVAHHGGQDAADPATFAAFNPRVAVMNNGLKKGGARETYETLHHVAGLEDVWQLHTSANALELNFADSQIANLDESTNYWIKLIAHEDGSFRVLNPRTGKWKEYPPRAPAR
jgi:competence protein ComEC